MNNKKLTITIGVAAHNEEHSILRLLHSIPKQKQTAYQIKKIIVASDGSKDNTVGKVLSLKDKKIQAIKGETNKGRIYRLNQMMKAANTDILLFLDADEELADTDAINKLVREFMKDQKVYLVGGNPWTVGNNNFVSRSFEVTREAYTELRYLLNKGSNIYGCMGGMLALRKEFYKSVKIPTNIYADDSYLYLTCITRGYKFKNVRNARILHHFSITLKSHIKRSKRYVDTRTDLQNHFGEIVNKEFYIPKALLIKTLIKNFLRHPIYASFIFLVNSYCRLTAPRNVKKKGTYAY